MKGKRSLFRGRWWGRSAGLAGIVLCLALFAVNAEQALGAEPVWTLWERSHAVAREKDWLVIDPPGASACYMKQSYPDPGKMEISLVREGNLLVCGPFYPEEEGRARLTYRFRPGGEVHSLKRGEVSNCIVLPKDLLPGFKSGYTLGLTVVLTDREDKTLKQEFSLMGFTAAHRVLQSGVCKP
ncbi:MAG: invasion associated locus B family protein [Desulfohalobiaceae bacterium]|nr:invasion associated locus B family protein [Desulfohalobiaceae bacterium]MCF8085422.1 invasion associated locus B family protein [Desulfohalobiaceae bacterium]